MEDLLQKSITPANEESTVRTYQCTYYHSRLLGLQASGFLSVTNKRVIFQASGTSNAGSSVIQSEVPLEDVSGISSYKGTYFSFGQLLLALVVTIALAGFLNTIAGLISAALRDSNTVLMWVIAIAALVVSLFLKRENLFRPVLAGVSSIGFVMAGGVASMMSSVNFLFGSYGRNSGAGAAIGILLAMIVGIYALACIFWYARRPTFSLAIHSKGGSSTPISISGATGLGIFDVAAGKALNAEPAKDAETMLQQLGALILDLQQMGTFGVEKWRNLSMGH